MDLELLYGRGVLTIRLPDDLEVTVVRKPAMPVLPSPEEGVRAAVAASVRRSGDRAVAVIPEGPYVLPALAGAEDPHPAAPPA